MPQEPTWSDYDLRFFSVIHDSNFDQDLSHGFVSFCRAQVVDQFNVDFGDLLLSNKL